MSNKENVTEQEIITEKEIVMLLKKFFKNTKDLNVECIETFKKMLIIRMCNKKHFCVTVCEA